MFRRRKRECKLSRAIKPRSCFHPNHHANDRVPPLCSEPGRSGVWYSANSANSAAYGRVFSGFGVRMWRSKFAHPARDLSGRCRCSSNDQGSQGDGSARGWPLMPAQDESQSSSHQKNRSRWWGFRTSRLSVWGCKICHVSTRTREPATARPPRKCGKSRTNWTHRAVPAPDSGGDS